MAEFSLNLVVEATWFSSQKVVGFQCSPALVIRCHWYSVLVFSCAASIKMTSCALYDKTCICTCSQTVGLVARAVVDKVVKFALSKEPFRVTVLQVSDTK